MEQNPARDRFPREVLKAVIHRLKSPSLLSARALSKEEVEFLFRASHFFLEAFQRNETPTLLAGKTVAQLFFENSTRTRLAFETAIRKLGGAALTFTPGNSSLSKGESLTDTVKNLEALRPDAFIVRHSSSGASLHLSRVTSRPIINAGDGTHEHPSQALLDAFTLERKWGSFSGKTVLIVGDLLHSRVARSNTHLLRTLGAQVIHCGPASLVPPLTSNLGAHEVSHSLDPVLPKADAVICLRIQRERQKSPLIPSLGEYATEFGLNARRAQLLKKEAWILHPGPVNRGVEITPEIADSARSLILEQVTHGVAMRMAILSALLNPGGLWRLIQPSSDTSP
jgi:aspartate carbamoyltransferase catalytic subunit